MMRYYAHSLENEPQEKWQTLEEHLQNTGELVAEFSKTFCDLEYAKNLGMLHDIGKYQKSFQDRLNGSKIPVEHAIYGAIEWLKLGYMESGAYCIAGHHSGLLDIGTKTDATELSTLNARIKRGKKENINCDEYKKEIKLQQIIKFPAKNAIDMKSNNSKSEYGFWTRMMFSCLTDADFLDTELFYNPNINRGARVDFKQALDEINKKIESFSIDTDVKKERDGLRKQIIAQKNKDAQIYFLNMPTGSGKTLSSMQFALEQAVKFNKKRIIYVIPYTSIIEQNAKVFKNIFGEDMILEHHSNFDYDDSAVSHSIKEKLMKASENWDADIIVTTNVQFFQSIYSNKTSQVRKIHNIADSIILFDEVHTLPITFFKPCIDAIRILTQRYNSKAVFMSATMPNFDRWLREFGCDDAITCDLVSDKSGYTKFKRCDIENLGEISYEKLIQKIEKCENSLVVVNKKSTAKEIYDTLTIKKYHLSTYMTNYDREKTIEQVKKSLLLNEKFCLVSTSLIEAGVDLDFKVAFRELSGLDNLLQTAGRCNREGYLDSATTHSFTFDDPKYNINIDDMKIKQRFTLDTLEKFADATSKEAIEYYFDKIYTYCKQDMEIRDFNTAIKSLGCRNEGVGFEFREYSEKFKLINDEKISIVIMNDKVKDIFNTSSVIDRYAKRKLQKYTVNLNDSEFKVLLDFGVIGEQSGITILTNMNYYDEDTGIKFDDQEEYIFS